MIKFSSVSQKIFFLILLLLLCLVMTSESVFAQAAQTAEALPRRSLGHQLMAMAPMFLMIVGIFYFLVVSPQKRELKNHELFLTNLKSGDEVLTSGGLIARVARIDKDHILLEIANNVRVKFDRAHVKQKPA